MHHIPVCVMKNVCSACTVAHTNWSHDFLRQVMLYLKQKIFNYLTTTACEKKLNLHTH